mgnify:FL=1
MQFAQQDIKLFWEDPVAYPSRRVPPEVRKALYRKLQMIDAAADISDLRVPPGNRLERLQGNMKGRYSIRVNDQWRVCFTWRNGEAIGVEFCDYHS